MVGAWGMGDQGVLHAQKEFPQLADLPGSCPIPSNFFKMCSNVEGHVGCWQMRWGRAPGQ